MRKFILITLLMSLMYSCHYNSEGDTKTNFSAEQIKKIELDVESARIKAEEERLAEIERNRLTPEKIDQAIDGIKNMNLIVFRGSVTKLMKEVIFLQDITNVYMRDQLNADAKLKAKIREYDNFVKNFKKREFPILRKEYRKICANTLWEHNIEVGGSGSTIIFTGGIFADNGTKSEYYTTLKDALFDLRFKRVIFKWYKYDDEYTYWDISSLKDSE